MEQVTRSDLRSPPLSYELGVIDLGKMKAYVCKPRILPPPPDWMLASDVSDPTDEADSSRWLSLLRLWAGSENRGVGGASRGIGSESFQGSRSHNIIKWMGDPLTQQKGTISCISEKTS